MADLMDSAVDNTLEDCKADAEAEKTKRLKRSRRPNAEVTASERKDEAQAASEEAEDAAESFVWVQNKQGQGRISCGTP